MGVERGGAVATWVGVEDFAGSMVAVRSGCLRAPELAAMRSLTSAMS